MRTLVFSDVHGNLPALEILLKKEKADFYVSLGDVVNYGPWSNECVDLIETLDCIKIKGNHEEYFINNKCPEKGLVKLFFDTCNPLFSRRRTIKKYKRYVITYSFLFHHFPTDELIRFWGVPCLSGHVHHQSVKEVNGIKKHIVRSVGQNRGFINKIDYAVLEDSKLTLESMLYDDSLIINEMKARRYPQELIDYYNNKPRCTTLS